MTDLGLLEQLASGVYILRFNAAGNVQVKKMLLVK
jgi:hypothetical protein